MEGLDITLTLHSEWANVEVYEYGQFAGYAKAEHATQHLALRGEVYAVLAERVGGALDYDVRWQPNEYEPERNSLPTALKLRACAAWRSR